MIPSIKSLNTSIPSRYHRNVSVNRLLEELFLEQWKASIDYKPYFSKCAPKICTYSYERRFNFAYMITTLISVYGGLEAILRFFIPTTVKYILKKRYIIMNKDPTHRKPLTSVKSKFNS